MAKQTINVGSGEYSGDGESIRIAFTKVNSNFTEVYTQVPLATTATYAQSFNTSTLVTSAVNATTSSFATTSGYALSFNTGTIVGTAVTATYAQSFNTSTLVRAAVSATNIVNGTWTLALSTAGTVTLPAGGVIADSATSIYVNPIRNSADTNILYYNTTTKEITYSSTDNITAVNITATNVSINTSGFLKLSAYSVSNLRAITGNIGWMAAVSDSLQGSDPNGMLAFWDSTNNRWSYIHNNGAV